MNGPRAREKPYTGYLVGVATEIALTAAIFAGAFLIIVGLGLLIK